MTILGSLAVSITVNPFILIPLIPLGIIIYFLQRYFVGPSRQLKRLDNTARSPIFVHTTSTIEGLTILRVANNEQLITKEFHDHCDNHSRAYLGFQIAHRWFGVRLDFTCSIFTIITLLACIFLRGIYT